jgi:hypothetical protein
MAKRSAAKRAGARSGVRRAASARDTKKKKSTRARVSRPPRRASGTTGKAAKPAALFAEIPDVDRREIGHVRLDVGRAGAARVKRMIYPAGFHWAADMKPVTGTDLCMHAHVGFLAHGEIHIEYADGCIREFRAPQIVAIEPGHDGWVVGKEPVVLIEFDFERDTVRKLGMPDAHRHD